MRTGLSCTYCRQTSNRRWNLSTHVKRKHKGKYNPFHDMRQKRQVIFFDSYSSEPSKPEPSNSLLSGHDPSDPLQMLEKSITFQNVIKEINQMNRNELYYVLATISKLFTNNSSNSLF